MARSLFSFTTQRSLLSLLLSSTSLSQVLQLHAQLITRALASDPFVASRLLLAISEIPVISSDATTYADLILSRCPRANTFIWNTVVRIHAAGLEPRRAVVVFRRMRQEGLDTDSYTYPFVLKACGLFLGWEEGGQIHGDVVKKGLDFDLFVTNGLISMCCRCGNLASARRLFDRFLEKDLVSWNAMIGGYASRGEMRQAQELFDEMPERDAFSWAIMIDGYGKKAMDVDSARRLFDCLPDRDLVCWNSMIDGYAGVGRMDDARELFEMMPTQNVISWSILIDGYVNHGDPKEALILFQQMLRQGIRADKVCAVGAISACAQLGALDLGRWVHFYLRKNKVLLDIVVQTALVDMYMKCGSLDHARMVFESMSDRNVISWNAMIVGLGTNGHGEKALELFFRMEREGAAMDDLTFLGVLSACTHAGLVDEGLSIFHRMKGDFGIEPSIEHYGCLVDLLGRAGRLAEAKNVLDTMPVEANPALWGSLLASCRVHRAVDMAAACVQHIAELGADDSGVYILMSNIYADKGMWEDVWRTRRLMGEKGMKKESGRSVIEVDGVVLEFVNGDRSHFLMEDMLRVTWCLSEMCTSLG
ncbi:hypothetical protein Taro_029844 [Colocasia esculenta]|uniref:Chlororespiratory reduction 4 n=1 Tax=Colocasia esculenta TaxID=4460 RepID=A0A843W1H9_COLES|nr:hypothetical protein [Colocasia esculenta]